MRNEAFVNRMHLIMVMLKRYQRIQTISPLDFIILFIHEPYELLSILHVFMHYTEVKAINSMDIQCIRCDFPLTHEMQTIQNQ